MQPPRKQPPGADDNTADVDADADAAALVAGDVAVVDVHMDVLDGGLGGDLCWVAACNVGSVIVRNPSVKQENRLFFEVRPDRPTPVVT